MKISTPDLSQLSPDWSQAKGKVFNEIEQLSTAISAGWDQEHDVDGSHKDISAQSLSLGDNPVGVPIELELMKTRFVFNLTDKYSPIGQYSWMRYVRVGSLVTLFFHLIGTFDNPGGVVEPFYLDVLLPEFKLSLIPNQPGYAATYGRGSITWQENFATFWTRSGVAVASIIYNDPSIFSVGPTGTMLQIIKITGDTLTSGYGKWNLNPAGASGNASDSTEIFGSFSFLAE